MALNTEKIQAQRDSAELQKYAQNVVLKNLNYNNN